MYRIIFFFLCVLGISCSRTEEYGDVVFVAQHDGPVIGYSKSSGSSVVSENGRIFKDIDKDGTRDVFEDWRQSSESRANSLVSILTVEEMIGLLSSRFHIQRTNPHIQVNHMQKAELSRGRLQIFRRSV